MTVRRKARALLPTFLRRARRPQGRRQKTSGAGKPVLSLILVPGDPSEEHAAARTLPSLLAESYDPMEIIVPGALVSAPAVRELAESDPRVRLMGPDSTLGGLPASHR